MHLRASRRILSPDWLDLLTGLSLDSVSPASHQIRLLDCLDTLPALATFSCWIGWILCGVSPDSHAGIGWIRSQLSPDSLTGLSLHSLTRCSYGYSSDSRGGFSHRTLSGFVRWTLAGGCLWDILAGCCLYIARFISVVFHLKIDLLKCVQPNTDYLRGV
jgi:hypothetical protein